MAIEAVEHVFSGSTTPYTSYDPTRTVLGRSIIQNTGTSDIDKWAGPWPIVVGQTRDTVTALAQGCSSIINISDTIDWFILGESTSSTSGTITTRIISLAKYDKSIRKFTWVGYITATVPFNGTAGYHNMYATAASRHLYTTGTVSVSGSTVTGNNTAWQAARFAVGARIGFGSTDPAQITTWYDISAITNDTSITILGTPGTLAGGTAFVIDELRIGMIMRNGTTTTNAGLYIIKGIHEGTFNMSGTVIPAATTTDNIRAVYWLTETANTGHIAACGVAFDTPVSNTEHYAYVIQAPTTTTAIIYKYNIRAALSLTAGNTTSAYTTKTATSQATAGAMTTTNNGKIFTMSHGPNAGQKCMFIGCTTPARVYTVPLSQVYLNNATIFSNGFLDVPPASAGSYALSITYNNVDYSSLIDRLLISGALAIRHYIAQFGTNAVPFDNWFTTCVGQLDRYNTLLDTTPIPSNYTVCTYHASGDVCYLVRDALIYAIPLFVNWDYAATINQRLITPAINTPKAMRLVRAYANADTMLGTDSLGQQTDPYRLYARTSGISDNSGAWTLLDSTGDLSSLTASTQVQLMVEFKLQWTCIPTRIHSLMVTYETATTDSHFAFNAALTDTSTSRFVWRFTQAFGTTVPALAVFLYDDANDIPLVIDYTDDAKGTFEKSTNGSSWGSWNTTDKANETTYLRYTPTSLPSGKRIRPILTLRYT